MAVTKTEKLYLDDAYTTSFQANVVDVKVASGGKGLEVFLDRSYFYPESGGQLADRGRLGGRAVAEVQEFADGTVAHRLDSSTATPGGSVECSVDWDRRFDHMQQHTGQHVLSRAFIRTGGVPTVSFHMGEESCTIDVAGRVDEELVRAAEEMSNDVIEQNRRVEVKVVPASSIKDGETRGKVPAGVTDARLVSIADFDSVPCCGTHVRATGELAVIKVLKWEAVREGQRVHFKVGRRAVADFHHKHAVVRDLATRLTTGSTEVLARVEKMVAENQSRAKQIKMLSQRLAVVESAALASEAVRCGRVNTVVELIPDADATYLNLLSGHIADGDDALAVLAGTNGIVACRASKGVEVDCGAMLANIVRASGGSGGGKGGAATFKMPDGTDMGEFVKKVKAYVQESLS